ncbi:putative acyl-coa-binding protein [Dermatophagoides farinae]|nr:putative acyl-coa-binding protein [Dermatophagoides farinae]
MKFEEAAESVKNLKKRPTDNELLELYGYYKQATIGDCNTDRPGLLDPKGRYKWDQWNKLKGMTNEEASKKYIEIVEKLLEKYRD